MPKIRFVLVLLGMLFCLGTTATAQVSVGIGLPNVRIGINLPLFPELVPVPGYPVYYAPQVGANYFFYDGMFWVYQNDYWYASPWYNGPWSLVEPEYVPLYVLRVPVRYYREPPVYFRGWPSHRPPRWGEHWGRGWEQHHRGWDRWQRSSAPSRAPLPVYQRRYAGDRYPRVEQQPILRREHYRYQPRDKVVRQHFRHVESEARRPARQGGGEAPATRAPRQRDVGHPAPPPRGEVQRPAPVQHPPQQRGPAPHEQAPQRGPGAQEQRQHPGPAHEQRQPPAAVQREQHAPGPHNEGPRGREGEHGKGHEQGPRQDEGRGR